MKDAIKDNIVCVFVCLNDPGQPPEYFVCTSEEARERQGMSGRRFPGVRSRPPAVDVAAARRYKEMTFPDRLAQFAGCESDVGHLKVAPTTEAYVWRRE